MSAQRAAQLVEAGLWLQMSGDAEGARRLFEQALKLDPGNARAQQLLGATAPQNGPLPHLLSVPPPPSIRPEPPAELRRGTAMDWSGAMGLADPTSPSKPVPPGMLARGEPASDEPAVQALSEPMPALPSSGPLTGEDELDRPVPLPSSAARSAAEAPDPARVTPVSFSSVATSAWDSQSSPGVHLDDVKPGVGDAMDMVAPQQPREADEGSRVDDEVDTLMQGAKDLLDLDDHSGAMDLILKAQQLAPGDPKVQALRERSEKTLQAMFESKLGPMSGRPRVQLKDDEIIWLNLDHRAGFVLAQIDGNVSFEDLFEVCGMSRLDTARILAQLVEEGVITLE